MNRDTGGSAILMMALSALVALVGLAAASIGVLLAERERAIAGAEAAALAAAVATYPAAAGAAPLDVAHEMVASNGLTLVTCRCPVDVGLDARVVTVTASTEVVLPILGPVVVTGAANAEFDPRAWLGR